MSDEHKGFDIWKLLIIFLVFGYFVIFFKIGMIDRNIDGHLEIMQAINDNVEDIVGILDTHNDLFADAFYKIESINCSKELCYNVTMSAADTHTKRDLGYGGINGKNG